MKTILLACAAVAVATGANAATVVFDFSLAPHQNNIGNTETYTVGGLSIFASGFNWTGGTADLYGKHGGGNENGLGLANDPTHDNEIHYHSGFVQLDLSGLIGRTVGFGTNSTTGGEAWTVYGTNMAGSLAGSTQLVTGSTQVTNQALTGIGTYRYFDFVETGTGGGQNFLISKVTTSSIPDRPNGPVPEPASWLLMVAGFGGLGAAMRRRRALTVTA